MKKNYSIMSGSFTRIGKLFRSEKLQEQLTLQKFKFFSAFINALPLVLLTILGNNANAQSALSFGSNNTTTHVAFGNKTALGLSQFTLECWFKRTGTGVTTSTGTGGVTTAIPLITKGTSEGDGSTIDCNYFMGINTSGNTLCADFEEGAGGTSPGLNHPISGVTAIVNNVWYHAAATYDGATWKLYLNGILEATLAVNQPCQNLSIQHSSIGSSIRSNGTTLQGFFAGVIDEARIWNSARSISSIQSTINSQISTPQSGLVAGWRLNEGAGTTVGDISGNALNGTITGTNYTWTTSVAPFNLVFSSNVAPTITSNGPVNGSKCFGTGPVTLSVNVNDANTSDLLTVKFYGRKKAKAPDNFSMIALPDTQFYTEQTNGGNNSTFKAQTSWIVANKDALGIKHVSQLGDCVQNGDNGGNDIEWKRADTSMKIIENPITTALTDGIPYTMNVGNHDQSPGGSATGTTTFFNQYFGTSRFASRAYWGGNYGSNADNSYQLFSANGMDFIVISFEYDPAANASVLSWANTLLQTYSTRKAIIVSHWIINANGTFGAQGQAIYNALKGNTNLMLMLCGHINPNGEARRSDVFNGKTVHTLLSDYQDINGGNGWLRIMTFSPETNTVAVKTYSPTLNQYQTDANSQFTISDVNLFDNPEAYQLLSTQTTVGAGTLTYNWTSVLADSTYEWYATVSDTTLTTTLASATFTPGSNPVVTIGNDTSLLCGQQLILDAGNPAQNYLWSTGATTQTISVNLEGTYYVKVTNPASGCFNSDTIVVSYPGKTDVSITKITSANCSGGSSLLTATAGMSSYLWSTGATTNAITVTNSGTYSVFATDSTGCNDTASIAVISAPTLNAVATVTNITCNGANNGAINVAVTGGTTPYTYAWSNGSVTQNISSLAAGTYTLTITDASSCTFILPATVTEPAVLSLTAPTLTTTNGGYNGTIKVNPVGGTTPYTYTWKYNNGSSAITTQTLSTTHVGGSYFVTVKDNKNCTVTATYAHAIPAVAQTNVLLPWSSTWKYKDDGSNQGTAWRASAFDDSAWPSAVAEFGYGDGDETTLVNACGTVQQTPTCTNKYLTTYLRKKINIASTAAFQSIKFNTFRDDGIIVFVNGTEVYRSGVQTGTINYNTTLSSSASDDGETLQTQTVTLAASLLVVGDNTIAVELHQQNGSSSDLTFNMEILATTATPPVVTTTPYLQPVTPNALYTTILTTGDVVNGYTMCGTPDGLGAFDNGNGTFTILMNHEFGSTAGVARAHGSKGAFVSKWIVNKSNLSVVSGADLIQTVKLWNGTGYTTYNSSNPSSLTAFNRFCSADLPAVSAFYNSATGLGTQERIFMNGEEAGSEGRGFAHIATGSEAGTSYELPYLGKFSWENAVACPFTGDKTVVAGLDDATPGQVYFYIGTKTNTGNDIEKAGLNNGKLYGIAVTGLSSETSGSVPAPNSTFTLADLGQVQNLTGATINTNSNNLGVTTFLRPEDGAWDPSSPGDFYFVTTNAFNSPSRLWKAHFNDINNLPAGGTITAVLDGTEGQQMLDNFGIDNSGHILLQEDVGGNAHLGKTWQYTIATDELKQVGTHDATRFVTGGANFLTQDEEASGMIDVQSILGPGMFLSTDQAHYGIPGELVEGGQLLAFYNPDSYSANPLVYDVTGGGSYCVGDTTGVTINLSNSQLGVTYTLVRNDSIIVDSLVGTGSSLTFTNVFGAGTYKVIAKNTSTGLTANMNGTATIIVNSLPADINQNGTVDVADLSQLLLNFGITCTCPSDINQDGQVNVADLSQLLLTFGQTCSGVFPINPSGSAQEN